MDDVVEVDATFQLLEERRKGRAQFEREEGGFILARSAVIERMGKRYG